MVLQDKIIRNKDKGNFLVRYYKSFFHALNGFLYSLVREHNMIIMILATIFSISMGFLYKIHSIEWCLIIICCFSVMASEMMNTAIEAVVDLVTLEYSPLAKIAKDTASTSSLLLSIMSLIVFIIIFLPKILGGL